MVSNSKDQTSSENWLAQEGCNPNDIAAFHKRLHSVASARKLEVKTLGKIKKDDLVLVTNNSSNKGPNLLIAGGFHGDEPAGSWAITRYLETISQSILSNANLSFLPLVNPSGFRKSRRRNDWDEDPNRGFCHTNSGKPEVSHEGTILFEHLGELKRLGKDGYLSLHEDLELEKFYFYTFERSEMPGPLYKILYRAESKYFEPCPDGPWEGGIIRNGLIYCFHDGSFEDLLFHEGIDQTACTESPGLLDINKRVEANVGIISSFVSFTIDNYK